MSYLEDRVARVDQVVQLDLVYQLDPCRRLDLRGLVHRDLQQGPDLLLFRRPRYRRALLLGLVCLEYRPCLWGLEGLVDRQH